MVSPPSRSPQVSVVLLNWNGGAVAANAAASVRAQSRRDVQLVVVDNASNDGSLQLIDERAEPDIVIRHDDNVGFAAGMNAGTSAASGDIVVLLNHDASLRHDFADTAVALFAEHDDAGLIGGTVVEVEHLPAPGWDQIPAGDSFVRARGFTASMRLWERVDVAGGVVPAVSGACPALRRAFVDEVVATFGELFDTSYDTYGEDVDLFARTPHTAWNIRFEPALVAAHVGSHSSQKRVSAKRGRLRSNVVQNRHRNVTRHSRPRRVVLNRLIATAEDVGFVAIRLVQRDLDALRDVRTAWAGARRCRPEDAEFRRRHGGLPTSVSGPRYRPLVRW